MFKRPKFGRRFIQKADVLHWYYYDGLGWERHNKGQGLKKCAANVLSTPTGFLLSHCVNIASNLLKWLDINYLQLFRERLSEKMCMRQSRKVIWDMINTPFLTLQLSDLLLLLSFSTRKHKSMVSRAILSNFLEKQSTQKHP